MVFQFNSDPPPDQIAPHSQHALNRFETGLFQFSRTDSHLNLYFWTDFGMFSLPSPCFLSCDRLGFLVDRYLALFGP